MMSSSAKISKSAERIAGQIDDQLCQLVATIRRLDAEGNYVDCEATVKAALLVVNGHTAAEALAMARTK